VGVARAGYDDVVAAAVSGDAHALARAFHKYDGATPDPWTQPATSDTLDNSGTAGTFTPLWTDEGGAQTSVIYDRTFNVYLAAYFNLKSGIKVRASRDLIHWSPPIGAPIQEPGSTLYYPTLMGEAADLSVGGPAPRVHFSSIPAFPSWQTSTLECVELKLSLPRLPVRERPGRSKDRF